MKKLLLITLLAFTINSAFAQFGLNLGANLANLGGKDATAANLGGDKKVIFRPHFGAFYNVAIGDHFSLQPEVGFSPEGVKLESQGEKAKLVINYITIGALARWNSGSGFNIGTGPQIGILQSAEVQIDGDPDEDIKDQLKGSDFKWMIRAGYDLPGGFGFYAGFNFGLGTIDDSSPADDIKNRVMQFGVRYSFNAGGKKDKKDK